MRTEEPRSERSVDEIDTLRHPSEQWSARVLRESKEHIKNTHREGTYMDQKSTRWLEGYLEGKLYGAEEASRRMRRGFFGYASVLSALCASSLAIRQRPGRSVWGLRRSAWWGLRWSDNVRPHGTRHPVLNEGTRSYGRDS